MIQTKVLATIGSGPMQNVLDVSSRTFRRYAAAHGYDYIEGGGESYGRPPAWGKVPLIRRLLDVYETVLWIDSDAIILDGRRDVLDELEPSDYQALVEHSFVDGVYPNTGVWVLRGQRGKDLVDAVWAMTDYIDHKWWENGAWMDLLGYQIGPGKRVRDSPWMEGTRWLGTEWNIHALQLGLQDGLIRHYAGLPNSYRQSRMRTDLDEMGPPLARGRAIMRRARLARSASEKLMPPRQS